MRLGVLALAFALSGCLDVEFGAEVQSLTQVQMTQKMTIDRRAWDMPGTPDMCSGADIQIGREAVVCRKATMFSTERQASGPLSTAFEIQGDALKVTFPTGARVAEFSKGLAEKIPPGDIAEAAAVGRSVVWRIEGAEILAASVPFDAGAASVEMVVPMLQIRDAPGEVPREFWAVVRPK